MSPSRQIILDTETTGLYPGSGDRIVEFAGLEMVNRHLTEQNLHLYMHPERDMPEEAAAVHGLTIKVLEEKNAPVFAKVGREIADFLRGAELIIHNAKFDVGFLNMEFERMGLPTVEALGCKITDTLAMARAMFPGQKVSLDALCSRFEIDRSKRVYHGALIDCELLGEVYLAMTRGQFSLADSFAESAAEAQNEFSGPDASVYQAVNTIRQRSNLPALATGLSKEDMRAAIRRERRIELCFEQKRFYDIIRWGIAEDVMNKDLHGMKITSSSPADNRGKWVYEVVGLNHPHVFTKKMYMNPIPQSVIDQNSKIVQNPGY